MATQNAINNSLPGGPTTLVTINGASGSATGSTVTISGSVAIGGSGNNIITTGSSSTMMVKAAGFQGIYGDYPITNPQTLVTNSFNIGGRVNNTIEILTLPNGNIGDIITVISNTTPNNSFAPFTLHPPSGGTITYQNTAGTTSLTGSGPQRYACISLLCFASNSWSVIATTYSFTLT